AGVGVRAKLRKSPVLQGLCPVLAYARRYQPRSGDQGSPRGAGARNPVAPRGRRFLGSLGRPRPRPRPRREGGAMLRFLRRSQRWLMAVLIGTIGVVFALFIGVGAPLRRFGAGGPHGDVVVGVGPLVFGPAEFGRERARWEQQY